MSLKPLGPRVRVKKTSVLVGETTFLLEERSIPGQDDAVYEKNADVWEEVPRGQANVYVSTGSAEGLGGGRGGAAALAAPVCTLRGLRKFGYTDSKYGKRTAVRTVMALDKENGECAHVAAFSHGGQKYWVVGSKHVHMVLRDHKFDEDMRCPAYQELRYRVAIKIAALFLQTLQNADREQLFFVLSSNQYTANAEAIFADSQHIVDYNGVNDMRWFAIARAGPSAEGLCMAPEASQEIFTKCRLFTIARSERIEYPSKAYQALLDQIGQRTNSEGVVMYGSDEQGTVVCMWKEKSYPYVMERVVREAIKRGLVGTQLQGYVLMRLKQQKPELRKYFLSWEQQRLPFLVEFGAWIAEKFPLKNRDPWKISCQWLTLQRQFAALPEAERKAVAVRHKNELLSGVAAINSVVLVGPPGSGKSTLARALTLLLQRSGKSAVWLNQDEAGNRKAYIDAIRRHITSQETTHVILDKSNMEKGNRDDYLQLGLSPLVTVVFAHPEGPDAFRDLCVHRILERGDGHRSLYPQAFADKKQDPQKEITKIIGSFLDRSDMEDNMDETCMTVDTTQPPEVILGQVWQQLCSVDPSIPSFEEVQLALAESIAMTNKYEALLKQLSATQQLYAAVRLEPGDVEAVMQAVPQGIFAKKEIRREFHITVKYFGGVIDPKWFVEHADRLGQRVDVRVVEVVSDAKGVAAVVAPTFPCANKVPHITLACAPGTPPVYSNQLVVSDKAHRIKVDVPLTGVYVFM